MDTTIAIQQYSLRAYPGGWQAAFAAVKAMGIAAIEPWCGAVPNDPDAATSVEDLRASLRGAGVSVACGHVTTAEFEARYEEWRDLLLENGSSTWVIPFAQADSLDGWLSLLPTFRKIHERLSRDGLALAYHNHHMELEEYGGKRVMEHLLEEMPELRAQFHIGQFTPSRGISLPDWIRRYQGRVCALHVNDATNEGPARLGAGECRARESIETALETGVDTFILETDLTPESSDDVKRDLETLRGIVGA